MRTTLTLDDDVAAAIQRLRQEEGESLKGVVNRLLRAAIRDADRPPPPRGRFETRTVSLGRCKIGDLSDVAEALAIAEGEDFR